MNLKVFHVIHPDSEQLFLSFRSVVIWNFCTLEVSTNYEAFLLHFPRRVWSVCFGCARPPMADEGVAIWREVYALIFHTTADPVVYLN